MSLPLVNWDTVARSIRPVILLHLLLTGDISEYDNCLVRVTDGTTGGNRRRLGPIRSGLTREVEILSLTPHTGVHEEAAEATPSYPSLYLYAHGNMTHTGTSMGKAKMSMEIFAAVLKQWRQEELTYIREPEMGRGLQSHRKETRELAHT